MNTSPRHLIGISLITLGLLAIGCSGTSRAATTTPEGTGTTIVEGTNSATALPTSQLPDWVQDRLDRGDLNDDGVSDALARYVSATGGGGVSHRSACEDGARLDSVWPEGTALEVVAASSSECDGWTLVTDGETTSWVLDKYLDDQKPAPVTVSGGGGGGGNGLVQVVKYQHWEIPVSELRIAEVGETWCDAPSWQDPVGGDYVVKTVDGTAFVNPNPQLCGFGKVGEVAVVWVALP